MAKTTKEVDVWGACQVVRPTSVAELSAALQAAHQARTPIYPVGGGTSLEYGLPPAQPGVALHMSGLADVVDYPARDMTITVQAGMTLARLTELLAAEGQQLPIDAPHPDRATLGGLLATNFNGARRYGYGTLRDYVIGIKAVDGRGELFAGGGRVVKNVAGYDFCKLLTGSLGTLGVIYEVTLKLRPIPAASALVVCAPDNFRHVERLLADVVTSPVSCVAVEWLTGPEWTALAPWSDFSEPMDRQAGMLAYGLEGTAVEVNWLIEQQQRQWKSLGVHRSVVWRDENAQAAWRTLRDFPDHRPAPLVAQAVSVPSAISQLVQAAQATDDPISIQAHAGSGIAVLRWSEFPARGVTSVLTAGIGAAAARGQGHVRVLSNPDRLEMTARATWGGADLPYELLNHIKRQFDPASILNPRRFVYREPSVV